MGRRGFIRVKGDLPIARLAGKPQPLLEGGRGKGRWNALVMDVHDLELRLRNVYSGKASYESTTAVWACGVPGAGERVSESKLMFASDAFSLLRPGHSVDQETYCGVWAQSAADNFLITNRDSIAHTDRPQSLWLRVRRAFVQNSGPLFL